MSKREHKFDHFSDSYTTFKESLNGTIPSSLGNKYDMDKKKTINEEKKKKEIWIAYILWVVPISNHFGAFWFYVEAYIRGTISVVLTIFVILFGCLMWNSFKWERLTNMFMGDENNTNSIVTGSTIAFFVVDLIFIVCGIAWWIFSGIVLQNNVIRYNIREERIIYRAF